jgi:hypothetical protein
MDYNWQNIRDKAADQLGDHPTGELEQTIIDHFTDDPDRVIRTIDRIVKAHDRKPFTSPWAVIRADLNKAPTGDVTASPTKSRQRAIDNAKRWIENAGLHYDRADHVLADLFGDDYAKGPLTPHDTPELRAELTAYWQDQRPRGVQAEQDHEAWNAKAKADRHLVQALRSKPTSEDIDFT